MEKNSFLIFRSYERKGSENMLIPKPHIHGGVLRGCLVDCKSGELNHS